MGSSDAKINAGKAAAKPVAKSVQPSREQDMGFALRSVYQRTVEESVPDEMMDLLGKLG